MQHGRMHALHGRRMPEPEQSQLQHGGGRYPLAGVGDIDLALPQLRQHRHDGQRRDEVKQQMPRQYIGL